MLSAVIHCHLGMFWFALRWPLKVLKGSIIWVYDIDAVLCQLEWPVIRSKIQPHLSCCSQGLASTAAMSAMSFFHIWSKVRKPRGAIFL